MHAQVDTAFREIEESSFFSRSVTARQSSCGTLTIEGSSNGGDNGDNGDNGNGGDDGNGDGPMDRLTDPRVIVLGGLALGGLVYLNRS